MTDVVLILAGCAILVAPGLEYLTDIDPNPGGVSDD